MYSIALEIKTTEKMKGHGLQRQRYPSRLNLIEQNWLRLNLIEQNQLRISMRRHMGVEVIQLRKIVEHASKGLVASYSRKIS